MKKMFLVLALATVAFVPSAMAQVNNGTVNPGSIYSGSESTGASQQLYRPYYGGVYGGGGSYYTAPTYEYGTTGSGYREPEVVYEGAPVIVQQPIPYYRY